MVKKSPFKVAVIIMCLITFSSVRLEASFWSKAVAVAGFWYINTKANTFQWLCGLEPEYQKKYYGYKPLPEEDEKYIRAILSDVGVPETAPITTGLLVDNEKSCVVNGKTLIFASRAALGLGKPQAERSKDFSGYLDHLTLAALPFYVRHEACHWHHHDNTVKNLSKAALVNILWILTITKTSNPLGRIAMGWLLPQVVSHVINICLTKRHEKRADLFALATTKDPRQIDAWCTFLREQIAGVKQMTQDNYLRFLDDYTGNIFTAKTREKIAKNLMLIKRAFNNFFRDHPSDEWRLEQAEKRLVTGFPDFKITSRDSSWKPHWESPEEFRTEETHKL